MEWTKQDGIHTCVSARIRNTEIIRLTASKLRVFLSSAVADCASS